MADVRRSVERIIESDPVIKRGLQRGIINSRALARYILGVDSSGSTHDAVLGIIRRYPVSAQTKDPSHRIFEDCEISVRNKMADLAVEKSSDSMKKIAEFASAIKTTRGESLRVIVGLQSIRVVADQRTLQSFRETLPPREIIKYSDDLAEISLLFPDEAENAKGIIAKITAELALSDVNLVGIFSCAPEDIVMVTEKDTPKALDALQRMLREEAHSHNLQTG